MAYTMQIDGMEDISRMLTEMGDRAQGIAAQAVYEGASVMADAVTKEMEAVKTAPFDYAKNGQMRLPSPEEKDILLSAGIGIAKFDENGSEVSTSVGVNQNEYTDVSWKHMSRKARTNYRGSGGGSLKPVGVIANAINSGTSFMKKQPFIRKGAKAGKAKAETAMKTKIESAFSEMTK